MNKGLNTFFALIIVVALFIASGAFYTVDETQQAVITQFGKLVGEPKKEAGLYFKLPFIQTANYFDKRILQWDGDADQIPTREKRLIWVDTTARWRIKDPLKYMKRMRTEISAQSKLDDIIDGKTREVISSHQLIEAIRNSNRIIEVMNSNAESIIGGFGKIDLQEISEGREALAQKILEKSAAAVADFGIERIDVKVKRINYVEGVRNKVYERMISERKRAAEQFRSEGQGKRAEIEGQMVKELEEIKSGAYKTAQEIKGKADAEAIKIYADAYNKDPEFYSFIKTLESYKNTINKDTNLIFTTKNEFYQQLNGVGKNRQLP